MSKMKKTNAMRIMDKNKIDYKIYEYEFTEKRINGLTVANSIGLNPKRVFKTLVTQGNTKGYYVFVVPVGEELDLKKAARAAGVKKVEMIPSNDLLKVTGYVHGGCSPVGMKKNYETFIDESVMSFERMVCSGGRRGVQIDVSVLELIELVNIKTADICLYKK